MRFNIQNWELRAPVGPHYGSNLVFGFAEITEGPMDVPRDVSEHYSIFKSFLFFLLQMWLGPLLAMVPPTAIYVC